MSDIDHLMLLLRIDHKLTLIAEKLGANLDPIVASEIVAKQAKKQLQAELLSRSEAALYTRRHVKTFDDTLRPELNNYGTERRPLYSKKEIDEWLNLVPGPSEKLGEAPTTTSASPTTESVTKSQRARLILQKLRALRNDDTEKS